MIAHCLPIPLPSPSLSPFPSPFSSCHPARSTLHSLFDRASSPNDYPLPNPLPSPFLSTFLSMLPSPFPSPFDQASSPDDLAASESRVLVEGAPPDLSHHQLGSELAQLDTLRKPVPDLLSRGAREHLPRDSRDFDDDLDFWAP